MKSEELVAAVGPSLQMFMEQNNAMIDSNPDAIYGEHMRMELDRDGKMINFGKTIANMSEWAFNSGVEQLQNKSYRFVRYCFLHQTLQLNQSYPEHEKSMLVLLHLLSLQPMPLMVIA